MTPQFVELAAFLGLCTSLFGLGFTLGAVFGVLLVEVRRTGR